VFLKDYKVNRCYSPFSHAKYGLKQGDNARCFCLVFIKLSFCCGASFAAYNHLQVEHSVKNNLMEMLTKVWSVY